MTSLESSVENLSLEAENKISKVSKKAKRIAKEENKEKKHKLDVIKTRIDNERLISIKNQQQTIDSAIAKNDSVTNNITTNIINNNSTNENVTVKIPGHQSCNTCGGDFADATAYRSHFRYN